MLNNFVPQIYNKSLEKLKAQVAEHNPDCINVILDGWSAFHHGYMGVIMSKTTFPPLFLLLLFSAYVHKWERYYPCFGVHPFDESHTSLNLATWLKVRREAMSSLLTDMSSLLSLLTFLLLLELLQAWGIVDRLT